MTDDPQNNTGVSQPLIVLVDGTYQLFRCYHALPPLKTKDGEATWAVLGCLNVLDKLVRRHQPEILVVVFDASGGSFRNQMLPSYKGNRPPTPPDLISQLERVKEVLSARGLTMICEPGVEADDVIASLANQAKAAGAATIIASNDKDLMQLVGPQVTVEDHKGTLFDAAAVQEKFSVPPSAMVDYLCLTGDQSDNIPGVDKVGPKTAAAWLQQYGSLQGVIDNADKIKGKVGENLRLSIPQMHLNRQLIKLKDDVNLPAIGSMRQSAGSPALLLQLYEQLELRSLAAKLPKLQPDLIAPTVETVVAAEPPQRIILDAAALEKLVQELDKCGQFAIYVLGTSFRAHNVSAVGLGIAADDDGHEWTAYIPFGQSTLEGLGQLPVPVVFKNIKPLLTSCSVGKITWNLKGFIHTALENGCPAPNFCADVMLQAYTLDGNGAPHRLAELAKTLPPPFPQEQSALCGSGRNKSLLAELPEATLANQASACALACLRLHATYKKQLDSSQCQKLRAVLEDMDLPLAPVLAQMEQNGVLIDGDKLKRQSSALATRLKEIETAAYQVAGTEFNIDSPTQIRQLLFHKLGMPVLRKTPQGQSSTAEAVLEELDAEGSSPLPGMILEYRALSKLKSTYTDNLPKDINHSSGRIHTSYQQAGVATGRLASANPNLQNIPVRSLEGRKIRSAFIAADGYQLLAADYAQIELRIMAQLSGDEALLEAFRNNRDVHDETAAGIFGLGTDHKPNREQRRMAKIINFGLMYGMSTFSLGRRLKIPHADAEIYVSNYFSRYPKVREFMENCRELAKKQGFVETIYGRKVSLPAINSPKATQRSHAERAAINAPMQGTAADIIRLAMVRMDNWITNIQPKVRMIMQVHDELVFEVPNELVDETRAAVQECMVWSCPEIDVALQVNISSGSNWEQAH
ncbi:MAG: DNA polymerase I [Candidatus Porifericomitaceae bacterium WSBS_2022_MAG_OTU9]